MNIERSYGKSYRIKSRTRFTVFVVFTMILCVLLINTLLGTYDAASLTVREYIAVEISSGDTLWQLAGEYMPKDMDIRTAVHEIADLNGIRADQLQAGQILQIPVYH